MAKTAFAKDQLKSFINRVERLEEEKHALSADIREVYAEAKGMGFDTKIMRQVVAKRKLDKADFQEQAAMFDLYWEAVGFDSTPLGNASSGGTKQNAPSSSKRDVSTKVEPSPEAGPQAEASHVGTESGMLAGPEGHISEGAAHTDAAVATDRLSSVAPPPTSISAMNAPNYKRTIVAEIPAFLDRRERPPPQAAV